MTAPKDLATIRYEVAERIATITLDRPERLNAWTGRMHTEYRACLQAAETDPGVRVVIVTGAGRGFCAGPDYAEGVRAWMQKRVPDFPNR